MEALFVFRICFNHNFLYENYVIYHLVQQDGNFLQPCLLWSKLYNMFTQKKKKKKLYNIVYIIFVELLQVGSIGRRRLSAKFRHLFRLIAGLISLVFVSVFIPLIAVPHLTLQDIIVCILAFVPTGWGLLQVSKPS